MTTSIFYLVHFYIVYMSTYKFGSFQKTYCCLKSSVCILDNPQHSDDTKASGRLHMVIKVLKKLNKKSWSKSLVRSMIPFWLLSI